MRDGQSIFICLISEFWIYWNRKIAREREGEKKREMLEEMKERMSGEEKMWDGWRNYESKETEREWRENY